MDEKMEEPLAYCGLICRTCKIHLATREPDEEKRYEMKADIAKEITRHYGNEWNPDDVGECDGCKAEGGGLFCTGCRIRKCAVEKGISNCAFCNDYPCEALEVTTDPGARERLDKIRSGL